MTVSVAINITEKQTPLRRKLIWVYMHLNHTKSMMTL